MKKLQSYLVKPEQIRHRLNNVRFKHNFIEWSKNNLCGNSQDKLLNRNNNNNNNKNNQNRSKSPIQIHQKSIQLYQKKNNSLNNKENIRNHSNTTHVKNNNNGNINSIYGSRNKIKNNNNNNSLNKNNNRDSLRKINHSNINNHQAKFYQQQQHTPPYYSINKTIETADKLTSKQRNNSYSNIQFRQKYQQQFRTSSISNYENIKKYQNKKQQQQKYKSKQIQLKYAYRTKKGIQITNPNKINQDSLLIKTKLKQGQLNIFAVADGHGTFGHLISQSIVKNLCEIIQYQLETRQNYYRIHSIQTNINEIYDKIQKILTNSDINVNCSGSTLVNVFIQGNEIICANVGDSRAILARQIDRKSWEMIYLSQDQKPNLIGQKKRILKQGGKIHSFKDQQGNPVGPLRVWLPNQNLQGLAMSRSFGDNVSKNIGVIHQPEVIRMKIDRRDKFILVASDGVWQFLSNQEVLQLIVPYYRQNKLEQACDALLKLTYQRWTVDDNSIVDDITFILIFLQQ